MTCSKVWKDIMSSTTENVYNVPSGIGESTIVSHIGSAGTSLLPNRLLMFRGFKVNKSAGTIQK